MPGAAYSHWHQSRPRGQETGVALVMAVLPQQGLLAWMQLHAEVFQVLELPQAAATVLHRQTAAPVVWAAGLTAVGHDLFLA